MMTDSYEIREDQNYRPFQVFNLTQNYMTGGRYASRADAQHWIDAADEREPNLYLLNAFFTDWSGTDTIIQPGSEAEATYNRQKAEWEASHPMSERKPVEIPPPIEEAVFVERNARKVGEIIDDGQGNEYIVTRDSWYMNEEDVADMEDANDVFMSVGWYTPTRLRKVQ